MNCPKCKSENTERIDTFGYDWTETWECQDCDLVYGVMGRAPYDSQCLKSEVSE